MKLMFILHYPMKMFYVPLLAVLMGEKHETHSGRLYCYHFMPKMDYDLRQINNFHVYEGGWMPQISLQELSNKSSKI